MTTASIVHQLPGRLRMRIVAQRGNTDYFSKLSEKLAEIEDILSLQVNPFTGSVVLRYDGAAEQLLQRIQERIPNFAIEINHRIKDSNHLVNIRPFKLVSGRHISPMFMLGTALTAVGIIQGVRGKIAVPSITAFWYALDAFRQSGKTR